MKSIVAIAILASALITGCTRIPPSFAGVKVNNWASDDKGSVQSLGRGTVWYNPFTQDIYEFPLHIIRQTYDQGGQNPITVRAGKDNATVEFDAGLAYQFEEQKVQAIFRKFRVDPDTLASGYMRDMVRGAFNEAAANYTVMELLGPKLTEMQNAALDNVRKKLSPDGIVVDQLYVVGQPRIDEKINQAISQTLAAIQEANRAGELVRKATNEANARREEAKGVADAALIRAEAEAKSAALLNQQLTPLIIQNHALSKWNGVLPQYTGGSMPMITVPAGR
jgi:regulator of protease activity HflC (stomatin/prohibitin superfamily)